MGMFSTWHLLVIGLVALLLFGNRLPEVMRSIGRSINEFKRGLKEVDDGVHVDDRPAPRERLSPPDNSTSATPRQETRQREPHEVEH